MKDFVEFMFKVLGLTFVSLFILWECGLVYFVSSTTLITKYEFNSMCAGKAQCELDNQGKECILIWDYLPVEKSK